MDTTLSIVPMSGSQWKHTCLGFNPSYLLNFLFWSVTVIIFQYIVCMEMHTCAYEHDIILAIFCFYFIHHYLGELVVHICFDYDRSIVNGVDRVEHGWVASGEGHNLIRKVLGCIESSKCLAWALQRKFVGVTLTLENINQKFARSIAHRQSSLAFAVLTVPGRG